MLDILYQRYSDWRQQQIARRKLARLDDRLLADIGAERDSLGDFVAGHVTCAD